MHKFIRLAVVLAVIALLLATAAPALADPPGEKGDYRVGPTLGHQVDEFGDPIIKETPATVSIPNNNPAIGPADPTDAEPGDVFWPLDGPGGGNGSPGSG